MHRLQSPARALLATLAILMSGCATVPPVLWNAPEAPGSESDCDTITGVYENAGEDIRGQLSYLTPSWFPSLRPSLFVYETPPFSFDRVKEIRTVTISRKSRNHIEITASTGGEPFLVRNLVREKGEFDCQGDVLSFTTTNLTNTSSSIGTNSKKYSFYKSGGFLIQHIENRDNALVLLLPLRLGWTNTSRFKEITDHASGLLKD
jgi:hypothetical protein